MEASVEEGEVRATPGRKVVASEVEVASAATSAREVVNSEGLVEVVMEELPRTGASQGRGTRGWRKNCSEPRSSHTAIVASTSTSKNPWILLIPYFFLIFNPRYEDIPVEATGSEVPSPIANFAEVSPVFLFSLVSNGNLLPAELDSGTEIQH